MLPGADWNLIENTVCTESMTTSAGFQTGDLLEDALNAGFGER